MSHEIELVSDGDGLAVFGDPDAVDLFLRTAGVPSKELDLQQKLGSVLNTGSAAAQTGSQIAANSGRWVKLTEKSAEAMKVSHMMKGSSSGVQRAITTTKGGKITGILEFVKPGSIGSMLTSPAMLAGAAGVMAQLAMQQTMDEITDYLATIDEKVDDILRAQKDAAIAEMIGVGFVIDEAMTVREHTGRVSDVTWSKVQGTAQDIAAAQGYALRRLDALAEKLEKKQRNVGDVADAAAAAEATVEEWLAVLARCFQLQDGLAVLELDRVLDSSPAELDRHREGLQAARRKRRAQIAATTHSLLSRMDAAASTANEKALLHPFKAGNVVRSGNEVATDVVVFHERLGSDTTRQEIEAKRWVEAVDDARHDAVDFAEDSVKNTKRFSIAAFGFAKSTAEKVAHEVSERLPRRRGDDDETAADENPTSSLEK